MNHGLIGEIRAGARVTASRCVPRDDGIAGANWCLVNYRSVTGWVSQAGLMPVFATKSWLDYHLWEFTADGRKYGILIPDDPDWNRRINNAAFDQTVMAFKPYLAH